MKLGGDAREALIKIAEEKGIFIEGNILKIIDDEDDEKFRSYLDTAVSKDRETRTKRLEITKQIQQQNKELHEAQENNVRLMGELCEALFEAETAKQSAESSLDFLQKKTQFQLMGHIVKTALYLIVGVGIITSVMYGVSIVANSAEREIVGHTWSSMLGILITNSFSIIGTIMGVKYASQDKNED